MRRAHAPAVGQGDTGQAGDMTTKDFTMRKNPLVKRILFAIFAVAMAIIVAIAALLGFIFAPMLLAQVQGKVTIQTFQQGPITRSYRVYRPSRVNPHPGLVLMLHGANSTGFEQEVGSNFDAQADRLHWLVVYPDAVTQSDGWDAYGCCSHQGADDLAFLSGIIDHLEATDKVDPHRVYAAGISRGGMMVYKVACELSAKIAAIASVEGNMADKDGSIQRVHCLPNHPVSLVVIHGTADREVPVGGGKSLVGVESIAYAPLNDVIGKWRALDACGSHSSVRVSGSLTVSTWSCQGGSNVQLQLISGGVHSWPGTPAGLLLGLYTSGPPSLGPEASLNASHAIAGFFEAHALV
jgi:polyhydroxybutyrate depolymerase